MMEPTWALRDGGAKSGKIGVLQIVERCTHVNVVPRGFRATVNSEMLRSGEGLEVMRIVTLQTRDERKAHARGKEGIFAVSLLAAAPSGIAEDVDVRGPDGQPAVPVAGAVLMEGRIIFGAELRADDAGDSVHQRLVESGGESDGLRENGGVSRPGDAVQPFIPPVIRRNAEARDSIRAVFELGDFLLEGHAGDKIPHTLFDGQLRIQVLNFA